MGTPDYIAPEQAVESHTVDIRADLYSLGCTFYYLLAGRVPFPTGSLIQKINKHQFEEPQAVESLRADLPPGVARVVSTLMAKKPENRYQTPAEVVAALTEGGNNGSDSSLTAGTADQTVGGLRRVAPVTASSGDTLPSAFSYMAHREDTAAMESPQGLRQKQQERRWLLVSVGGGSFVLVAFVVILFLAFRGPGVKQAPSNVEAHPVVPATTSQSATVDDAWLIQVAALPAEKQVEAVIKKLRILNPRFDGKVTHKIEDGAVTEVQFWSDNVTDISPVKALMKLQKLECGGENRNQGAKFKDLSPLKGMSLRMLTCCWSSVADLSPLQGMPLVSLDCHVTKVFDLSPVKGLSLAYINCGYTRVSDLSPLKGMSLRNLSCGWSRVADLSPLQGMPLAQLDCSQTQVSDLSPLKGMPLMNLNCADTQVAGLSPLRNMKLTYLGCFRTKVFDLSPLRGMPLTFLECYGTKVSDLSPLKGMPLTNLNCADTQVAGLSPLRNTKLTSLRCGGTKVTDLSPLKGMPLKELWCDLKVGSDAKILRSIKTLERINDKPAAEFWKEVEATKPE